MNETYLEVGRRGKNTWWRYLLGVVFVVFLWFVVGGWASVALGNLLGISPGQIATNPSAAGPIAGFLVICAPYPVFLLGSVLVVTLLHRRSPLTLVTGRRSIDWGRVGTGLGVWFALAVVASLVGVLLDPSAFSLGPNLAAFVPFALLALILALASGVLFMLPHLANPGLDAGFLLVALYHFGFGAFLAWVSLKDGTLELAIGAHAANNLYVVVFVLLKRRTRQVP